jgi:glycosyltransferase involved in cell wall biosynthesis
MPPVGVGDVRCDYVNPRADAAKGRRGGKTGLRILFCNYEYPPLGGGGGVVMASLARELARRHEVTVLTSRAPGLAGLESDHGVRVIRVPVFFRTQLAVANFPSMLAYLPMATIRGMGFGRRAPFDIINTHFAVPSGPVGEALAWYCRVPNVLSVHGGDLYDPSKKLSPHRHAWLRYAVRRLLLGADAVVGQSRNTVGHVEEIYGVRRTVHLIPLGIDRPPPAAAASREELGLPRDAFVLISVGRLVARKDMVQLVRAVAASGCAAAHLLIVGDGPDAPEIRRAAAELGIAERVHLLGQVSDERKYRALAAADVFASTSQHEGFGLVFLEAMAYGLPVLCYDHGGQTDFLATGTTGHVLRLNDFDAFTRAIADLYHNSERRAKMGRYNRAAVEEFFIERCAERYEALFRETLERTGGS